MRLVDDEAADRRFGQPLQESRARQPLGRHVEEVEPAQPGDPQRLLLVGARKCRVDESRPHPELPQPVHLVLHERDQGRDDHREPAAGEGWHPVADRLAGSGRGHRQHVPSRQLRLNHLQLAGPELLQPEHVVENLARGHGSPV